jgi:hypothetical protein
MLVLAALACGGSAPTKAPAAQTPAKATTAQAAPGALRRYAALKVMLLPVQGVRSEGLPAWKVGAGRDTVVTRAADRALEEALGERGLATQWIYLPEMQRAARRNPTYVNDPYALRAADAMRSAMKKPDEPIAEPFASQLRALAGVTDSRYAIIPIELRFEPASGTMGHAILRLAAVDARGAQVIWIGEIAGDGVAAFSPDVITGLAQRFADLVVPR